MAKGQPLKQIEISEEAYKLLGADNVTGLVINRIVPIDCEINKSYLTSEGQDVKETSKAEWLEIANHTNQEVYSIWINGELIMHVTADGFEKIDFHNLEKV